MSFSISPRTMAKRKRKPTLAEAVVVIGATPHPIRDLYHWLLKADWILVLAFIVTLFELDVRQLDVLAPTAATEGFPDTWTPPTS
jgi:hypothetical protein